ncbi:MAG: cellulose-binding protein, partial [Bacilli bacterium]
VKYANVTHKDNIRYWEIGNEVYGNGTYGANWEEDLHKHKGPAAYAAHALAYIRAMKAVDSHIKVGVVLTIPGVWPNGLTPHWNRTVLSIVRSRINFVIIHWYPQNPGKESDAGLLNATSAIPAMMARLRSEIDRYCGPGAKNVQVFLTETNSVSFNPGKQTVSLVNALFLADDYMTWLQNGVANVDWWDVHNGPVTGTNDGKSLYGSATYGDYGILSSGTSQNGVSEPPAETPFPAYYGLQMVHILAQPGDQMLQAASTQPLVAVHAVAQKAGRMAVMLINKSPATTFRVALPLSPQGHFKTAAIYYYGENSKAVTSRKVPVPTKQLFLKLPPYSLTTVVLSR